MKCFFPSFSSVGQWQFDVIAGQFFSVKSIATRPADICFINCTLHFMQKRVSRESIIF